MISGVVVVERNTFSKPFFSFKSGCVIQVAKHLKEDWFIVLH